MGSGERKRILIADDQEDVLVALRLLLKAEGFDVVPVLTPAALVEAAESESPDLILMDLNYTRDTTSGQEGLEILARLAAMANAAPIIVMTAWGSVELAVEAMRLGAADFVLKPWDNARLLAKLRGACTAERRDGIAGDLAVARKVQANLMPQRQPRLTTLDYAGHCRQAGAIGGDYFDFLELGPGLLGLVLGDISGKGIGAALLMANLQAALRSLAPMAASNLPFLLENLNRQFREATAPEQYATLFFGIYDDAARTLRFANCGHWPPLVLRAGGCVEYLQPTATVIGLFTDFRAEVRTVRLGAGDRVAVYSDGLTEACLAPDQELGREGLARLLRSHPEESAAQITARVSGAMCGTAVDDMTLVLGEVH